MTGGRVRTGTTGAIAALAVGMLVGACAASPTAGTTVDRLSTQSSGSTWHGGAPKHWSAVVDPTAVPLGDGKISTTPERGSINSCQTTFGGRGAAHEGPWIDDANGTWDSTAKVAVTGKNKWPQATYVERTKHSTRVIKTDDLPVKSYTGNFPIATDDPAYQYDRNPNHVAEHTTTFRLPLKPAKASSASCVNMGAIGVLKNGVFLYNAIDAAGNDAVAHETQDSCDGHPDGTEAYHYHDIPSCLLTATPQHRGSTLVGYALDGYGIYVERDRTGNLPTDADLDKCHGRTSKVLWNGKKQRIYHYSATREFPYTVGCFRGTPVSPPAHA